MLPFTYAMYKDYENARFEYEYAIAQLSDESTLGDFREIEFLKKRLQLFFY